MAAKRMEVRIDTPARRPRRFVTARGRGKNGHLALTNRFGRWAVGGGHNELGAHWAGFFGRSFCLSVHDADCLRKRMANGGVKFNRCLLP